MTSLLRRRMEPLVGEITRQQPPMRTATFGLRQSSSRQRVRVSHLTAHSSHTGALSSRESLERTTSSRLLKNPFETTNAPRCLASDTVGGLRGCEKNGGSLSLWERAARSAG